jgi:hypothetical protein
LVGGAGAAGVICTGKFAFEDGVIERVDLGIGWKAVAEEHAVAALDGQWQCQQVFGDADGDGIGPRAEITPDAIIECFTNAQAAFHDSFAVNLSEIMIGEKEMDLAGEITFELGGGEKHLPTVFGTVGIVMIAVNHLVENEMALRVIGKVSVVNEFVEIGAMIVEITGHPDFTGFGKGDDLMLAQGTQPVFFPRCVKDFQDFRRINRHRHSIGKGSLAFRQQHRIFSADNMQASLP